MFDEAEIEVRCPKCGEQNPRTVRSLRAKEEFDCAGCGATIVPDGDLDERLRSADKTVEELRRAIRKLGKR